MSKSTEAPQIIIDSAESGWTFVETLVVIGIILILTAGVGIMSFKYLDKAKVVSAKSQIETFSLALDSYYVDCGQYPTEEEGVAALWEKPSQDSAISGWNGPYLTKAPPLDPWGNAYQYLCPGKNEQPYSIRCLGADKAEGGTGINADITTWE